MKKEKEVENLKNFVNYLSNSEGKTNSQQDVTGIYGLLSRSLDNFKLFNYFLFVPKADTNLSKNNLNLSIELKCLSKSENVKSLLNGMTIFYFLCLFNVKKSVFGFRMISCLIGTGILTTYMIYQNNKPILEIMDILMRKEVEHLYERVKREEEGFDKKLIDELDKNAKLIQELEDKDYIKTEDGNKTYTQQYISKSYDKNQREQLIDLVKFYSEWLYGPVDEDLENKFYFLDYEHKGIEDYVYPQIKNSYELDKKVGIRILKNNKI